MKRCIGLSSLLISLMTLLGQDACQEPTPTPTPDMCVVTGCSGQICAPEPVMSTCEWTCEYGCYQFATCEIQPAGFCGWTSSKDFEACMNACGSNF